MWWETQQWRFGRWEFMMICQHKAWSLTAHRSILRVGNGCVADKIGPAIPRALAHFKEQIRDVANRAAAAIVRALIDGQQSSIGQEAKPEGVANAPGDQFQFAAVRIAAHNRRRAGELRSNTLAWHGRCAKGDKGACARSCIRLAAERVERLGIKTVQFDLVARDIMGVGQQAQPAQFIGVQANNTCIGHRTLTEIELAIRAKNDHIGVIVAGAGQVIQNHRLPPIQIKAAEARRMPTFRHIEAPLVVGQAVHRRAQSFNEQRPRSVTFEPPHAATSPRSTEGQTRLGNIRRTSLIEGEAGRKRKALRHQFQLPVAFNRNHVFPSPSLNKQNNIEYVPDFMRSGLRTSGDLVKKWDGMQEQDRALSTRQPMLPGRAWYDRTHADVPCCAQQGTSACVLSYHAYCLMVVTS